MGEGLQTAVKDGGEPQVRGSWGGGAVKDGGVCVHGDGRGSRGCQCGNQGGQTPQYILRLSRSPVLMLSAC